MVDTLDLNFFGLFSVQRWCPMSAKQVDAACHENAAMEQQ
jgi:hypothetical protein